MEIVSIGRRTSVGLTSQEVEEQRRLYGENMLTPPATTSMWRLYLEKYDDPIIRILLVAAVVSLVLAFVRSDFVETIGIILAIFLATTIGFYFERDAAGKFRLLTQLGEEQPVKVMRDGCVQLVPRREVVVGDVVLIETGDEVPADGRLLSAVELQMDESALTGEPLTMKQVLAKGDDEADGVGGATGFSNTTADAANTVAEDSKTIADDANASAYPADMVLRSSMVMSGNGTYVVTAVGDRTEIGHVAQQATEITTVKTPLNMQLDRLASLISKVGSAVAMAAFVLFLGHDILTNALWHGTDYVQMAGVVLKYFMMSITLIVMAVPEGLPMAVTLALALNMRRMLKSNILVRKLSAGETMGAATVICTDKTGTLTQNKMAVADMKMYSSTPEQLYKAIAINTTATHDVGNPTEQALLRWLQSEGCSYQVVRETAHITACTPFSTERKYMSTEADGTVFVKGAPEIVMQMCEATDAAVRRDAEQALLGYQQRAMRTLAFACGTPLQLQAICAISDPLREDVPKAVAECRRAGIEVKIVTGDTAATAQEIARQIGIEGGHITGQEFSMLSDEDAKKRLPLLRVMSRARPVDKCRLVDLLQQTGAVVAVTGDGTNDAPALNHAHVGLSLGSGTSVAKQASDITLLDDSFRAIVHAVMWGRSLYKNIQRFIFYQLVVNVTALLLVFFGAFVGTELPLTITQILWINLIMDTFAAMALASLPPSREVMSDVPRSPSSFIISRPMMRGIAVTGGLFFVLSFALLFYFEQIAGVDATELTIFFTIFVLLQWWNLFNARMLGSCQSAFRRLWACRGFLLVLLLVLAGQWLIVTFGGQVFRTEPLGWRLWMYMLIGTSPVLWIGEIYRWIQRRWK